MTDKPTNPFAGAIGRHLAPNPGHPQKDSPAPLPETTVALPAPGSPRGLARILTIHEKQKRNQK